VIILNIIRTKKEINRNKEQNNTTSLAKTLANLKYHICYNLGMKVFMHCSFPIFLHHFIPILEKNYFIL